MNREEYTRMDAQETTGWWFVGKRRFLMSLLTAFRLTTALTPLLDAGCGTGAVLRMLDASSTTVPGEEQSSQKSLFGLDPAPEALRFAREKCRATLICGSAEQIPFAAGTFRTVCLLDVLEHLDDDQGALRETSRILRPGGYLVLAVPAFPFLWCDHDVALHHRRRYRRQQIRNLLDEAGFQTLYAGYSFASVFPAAVLFRLWRRLFPPPVPRADVGIVPPLLNRILCSVMELESRLIGKARLPFGTSLLILAQKPP